MDAIPLKSSSHMCFVYLLHAVILNFVALMSNGLAKIRSCLLCEAFYINTFR
jgi:hypothetical protein